MRLEAEKRVERDGEGAYIDAAYCSNWCFLRVQVVIRPGFYPLNSSPPLSIP
jgi:hypothetical protein